MNKILITGGTGFLGAYIIQEMVMKGYKVRAIRRSDHLPFYIPDSIFSQVEWLQGDILDIAGLEEAMEGVDGVIHAAAKISFRKSERKELIRTNIEGTANVVNVALSSNIQRFVHISSVAALGRTATGERITEEKKWENNRLNTNYAITKYHGEIEVWRGIAEGLPGVIVNPSTILGYGDWHTSSCAIFRTVYKEFPWYSNGVNGFVDVSDVARAIVTLLEGHTTGERFILNGDNWSFKQLFDTIATEFGKKKPTREVTPLLGSLAWRMETLKTLLSGSPSLVTKESAKVAQSKSYFDNGKILRHLPSFHFTPLENAIKNACKAYLQRLQPL